MVETDYSKKFLISPEIKVKDNGLCLIYNNTEICFKGKVFSVNAEGTLTTVVNIKNQKIEPVCYAENDCKILNYKYFDGEWENVDEIEIASTNYSGIAAFLRKDNISFFVSLDFPYSKIERINNKVTIGCDPMDKLNKGDKYIPHTITVGASVLTCNKVNQFYRSEIEAFSEYILNGMPVQFRGNRPIYTATSITNRMTDVRDGRIFYSMYDNPTLTLDPDTLKEEVKLCGELGVEYYQLFEGYYDWETDGSSERNLNEIVKIAKDSGVRVGDYMTALELNCWHYNYHNRHVKDKSLLASDESGNKYYLCYGNPKTVDMLEETIIPSIIRNQEEMICLDGNAVVPCYDATHGHNPGSYYSLIRGLVNFMEKLNETSPYFMTWSNAGNWIEFMPKLLWYNPNVYLTDPHPREYSSSLNSLKYYGDCRREQMVSVHNKYFVPYTAFTNCEYYTFKHSRVTDMEFFEYSFLQGLSVTPNICFGELRTFLERIPHKEYSKAKKFIKKWLSYIRANIDSWKYVYQVGESPAPGAKEIYAHINEDHGFVCIVNQNHKKDTVSFKLNESIGLKRKDNIKYLLSDVYPEEVPIYEQRLSGALVDDEITLEIPAYSVRIVKIVPYKKPENGYRFYGIKGELSEDKKAITLNVSVESGKPIKIGLYSENTINNIVAKTVKTVPKYFFESSISDINSEGNCTRFTLNVPRDHFNREISEWKINGSEKEYIINQKNSDFCGGYIHNFYKENQKIDIIIERENCNVYEIDESIENYNTKVEDISDVPTRRASVYTAKLDIPFIEYPNLANEIGFDEVLELVFKNSNMVKSLKAKIDGKDVDVCEFLYAANTMKAFYIELVGNVSSGTKPTLELNVEWNDNVVEKQFNEKKDSDGAQVIS